MSKLEIDFAAIRAAIASFELSPRIEPNDTIDVNRAYLPDGHRGVLDLRRQLVVGNRGMGKSFWTHALLSSDLRMRLAKVYGHPLLSRATVLVGFNGSVKVGATAPTTDEISNLVVGNDPDIIWRAVILRAAWSKLGVNVILPLKETMDAISQDPNLYSKCLSQLDDQLIAEKNSLVIVFDALDRLGRDWSSTRALTRSLLSLAVGLQSFNAIKTKIFMRVDLFTDRAIFGFPDSSKIKNDHVNLVWQPNELYGLFLFEILRNSGGGAALIALADQLDGKRALPVDGADSSSFVSEQNRVVNGIAGEFMGSDKKRGRVYTWVPLHLSDAANTCSPRSFLIAWKKAAEHNPAPLGIAIDRLGVLEGVRFASASRLAELYEDYRWIEPALRALRRQFVPMDRKQLFDLWIAKQVVQEISKAAASDPHNAPVGFSGGDELDSLLASMRSVAVIEERANGKINVPDIFRVEAEILRKGGVAVPRRYS